MFLGVSEHCSRHDHDEGPPVSRDAARREARRAIAATGMHRETWAKQAKLDPKTVSTFLEGATWPQAPTRKKIEDALGWPAGSLEDIADGQYVVEVTQGPHSRSRDAVDEWVINTVAKHMAGEFDNTDNRVLSAAVHPLSNEAMEQIPAPVLLALGSKLTVEVGRVFAELRRRADRDHEVVLPTWAQYDLAARTGTPLQAQIDAAEPDPNVDPPAPEDHDL